MIHWFDPVLNKHLFSTVLHAVGSSTLNICSNVLQIIIIIEDISFHIVKNIFKNSFQKGRYGFLRMCIANSLKTANFDCILP